MQEYASTIIYICIFAIILELILPDNKLKKYVGVLVSLIVILTLISPVVNVLKNDSVTEVISSTIDSIQSNIDVKEKEYDLSNVQNRLIFSSVKEDLEEDLYTKCKEKFDLKFGIKKVDIVLDEDYKIEEIDIYVNRLPEVANASEIIDYVSEEYSVETGLINVIREGE